MSGVYIILNETKSTDNELYIKIGCSKNIQNRFKQICASYKFNGSLDKLSLLTTIQCDKYKLLEKHLHILLNSKRIINNSRHEWFKTDEEFLNDRLMRVDLNYYRK